MKPPPSTPTYTVKTMAELLNLTERRVQQLASEGVIPKPERGSKYDLFGSVRGYIAYLQERAFGKETLPVDAHKERARLLKAQADKTELEVKTIQGELIPSNEVEAQWAGLAVAFRSRMLVLPTRGAHLALGVKAFHEIENSLRELVQEALTELSLYEPDTIRTPDLQNCKTGSASAEPPGKPMGQQLSPTE